MEIRRAVSQQGAITVDGATVTIEGMTLVDSAVADFLAGSDPQGRAERVAKALSVGVHGLSTMGLGVSLSEVDERVRRALAGVADEAERRIEHMLTQSRSVLTESLDPDVRTSLAARMIAEVEGLHTHLLGRLDPDRGDSHTGRLVDRIDSLLGPEGLLVKRLTAALDPAIDGSALGRHQARLEQQLTEIRDLVVGSRAKQREAQRGTAKGFEFEDVVEAAVRGEAASIGGCVVTRTGRTPGVLGPQTLVGDLVIDTPSCRVVVEVKDVSRIDLAGKGGILKELDEAAANREAGYAICVSRNEAFPAEVGVFGVYDKRVLVVDDGEGLLLGAALRWTLAAAERDRNAPIAVADGEAAMAHVQRIRDLANRLSNLKRTLTSISSGIDGIRGDVDAMRQELLDEIEELGRKLGIGRAERAEARVA